MSQRVEKGMSSRQHTNDQKAWLSDGTCGSRAASGGERDHSEMRESQPKDAEFPRSGVERKRMVRKTTRVGCADPLYITHI